MPWYFDDDIKSVYSSTTDGGYGRVATPTETVDGSDGTVLDGPAGIQPSSADGRPRWMDVPSSAALFTPILAHHALLKRQKACLPEPLASPPDASDLIYRPLSIDATVHAMFRVREAGDLAQHAAKLVAKWAMAREPPYAALASHLVEELLAAIPIMSATVDMARSCVYYSFIKTKARHKGLWYPPGALKSVEGGEKTNGSTYSGRPFDRLWWSRSDEHDKFLDTAEGALFELHKNTATGRSSWNKETQKLVSAMEDVLYILFCTADEELCDMDTLLSPSPMSDYVRDAADAVQHLTTLADNTASAIFYNRFWQWGAWINGKEKISPADAAAHLRAKLEAKAALTSAKKAAKQAVLAAKGAKEYK